MEILTGKNIKFSDIIKELDSHNYCLEKRITFYKMPLVALEAAQYAFVNNPFLLKYNVENKFHTILISRGNELEAWHDITIKPSLNNPNLINDILDSCQNIENVDTKDIKDFLCNQKNIYSNEQLIGILLRLNDLSKELNYQKLFINEECFNINNKEIAEKLQKLRLNTSNKYFTEVVEGYYKLINIISLRTFFSREFLFKVTNQEFIDIINDKEIRNQNFIPKRDFAMVIYENKYNIFFDNEAKEVVDYLDGLERLSLQKNNSEKIVGQVAYKGKVEGKALLLKVGDYLDPVKILEGKSKYVLVTPMTRPEIVIYMKDAIAIVTDEGGITCHAAIIARELEKPCIIGTKNATKIINNGDVVEVDADKGVVKILHKI